MIFFKFESKELKKGGDTCSTCGVHTCVHREKMEERDFSPTGLFPKWLQWLEQGHSKVRSQELPLLLPTGVRVPSSCIFCYCPWLLPGSWSRN